MTNNQFQHPLPIGFKIISIEGECDCDDLDVTRQTGPNAAGVIISANNYGFGQGWSYGVEFAPSGVWVNIDQSDGIDDPHRYRAAPSVIGGPA
jgi:hypothetical protein